MQFDNFECRNADSIFAIGASSFDKSLRYLKQIKARATEVIYDSENVMIFSITKHENYLGFAFTDFGKEKDHLKQQTESQNLKLEEDILELRKNNPTFSYKEIADRLMTYKVKVKRVLDKNGFGIGNS